MPFLRSIVAGLACASLALAADAAKLRTLNDLTIEGELAAITDKDVTLSTKDGPKTTPFAQVREIDLRPFATPRSDANCIDVELTDGSLLHCDQLTIKDNQVEAKLVSGPAVKLPLALVTYVLNGSQDEKLRDEWQRLVIARRGNHDVLATRKGGAGNAIAGTFGVGDDKGETIEFEHPRLGKKAIPLANVLGMWFYRKPDASEAPPLCTVFDTAHGSFVAAKVSRDAEGAFAVTTQAGVLLTFPGEAVVRLDFSKGNLKYLSDLEPMNKPEAFEGIEHFRRNKNLDGGPIFLGGKQYANGLSLHAGTELVYDIGGEFKDFSAVLGVDDQIGGDSHVKVTVEGDRKELYSVEVARKKTEPVKIDVRNIKQLRIVVQPLSLLGLGDHVTLAEARVVK